MPAADRLRLIALDAEDLAVLSAHVQDAVVKTGDMTWLPVQKRFALLLSRGARQFRHLPAARRPQR